jgi:protein ImuB
MGANAPPADAKLLLVARRVVMAVNPAAQHGGLQVGMKLARAQALVPDLICLPADPAADAAALERLALWALQRYAPIVALDAPDGLAIDITGAAHLHGGERALLADLCSRLAASGIVARAAVADTHGAAHALARYQTTPQLVVPPGETGAALLPLPLAGLRLPAEMLAALCELGFGGIGDLARQPRAPLVRRFGQSLIDRLDLAFGRIHAPIQPIRPPDLLAAEQNFADPIASPEALVLYIGRLVRTLCARLEKSGLGARRLDLLFHRVDGEIAALRIGTARPNRDAARLTRLLTDRLERVDPGLGVELLRLVATLAEPLAPVQAHSTLTEATTPDLSGLIDTLTNRLGAGRVYRMAPVESDVPERSQRRIAANAPSSGRSWQTQWPRPASLLPRPEPIETVALLPDNPPVSFTWRGVRRRVWRADGPERIFGEWWKRDAELSAVRDYFRVEDESGARFWLYRAGDGEDGETGPQSWFLHGLFG